jgi:hypothetical protein
MDLNDIICKDVRPKGTFHATSGHVTHFGRLFYFGYLFFNCFFFNKSEAINVQLGLYHLKKIHSKSTVMSFLSGAAQ